LRRLQLILVAALLLTGTSALAGERLPLLISTVELDGTQTFWWACDGRSTPPLIERLAAHVRNKSTSVVESCTGLSPPIHRSYRRANLRDYQLYNIANALDGTRLVAGRVVYEQGSTLPDLGLQHVKVTVQLTSHNIREEKKIASISVTGSGFAHSLTAAREQADLAVLFKLTTQWSKLFAQKKRAHRPRLRVRVDGLPTPRYLDKVVETLQSLPGVTEVRVDELRRGSALLVVLPITARQEVAGALVTLAPDVLLTIVP